MYQTNTYEYDAPLLLNYASNNELLQRMKTNE